MSGASDWEKIGTTQQNLNSDQVARRKSGGLGLRIVVFYSGCIHQITKRVEERSESDTALREENLEKDVKD
ncbi:MAG: hypothetical protein HC904_04290 [Blastochloris sp.]|nr:hypothetical protein [Blastochloris sp.]